MIRTYDISMWQDDKIVERLVQQSNGRTLGIIAKCSEGRTYRDPKFYDFIKECQTSGVLMGAYHFARPDLGTNPRDEAENLMSAVMEAGILGKCLLCVDVEGEALNYPGWTFNFCNIIYANTGIMPVLYVQQDAVHKFADCHKLGVYLWVAAWSETSGQTGNIQPWYNWLLHQYSNSGGKLDINTFNGNVDMWKQLSKRAIIPEPTPDKPGIDIEEGMGHCGCAGCKKLEEIKEIVNG